MPFPNFGEELSESEADVTMFTDGSKMDGKVGFGVTVQFKDESPPTEAKGALEGEKSVF